MIGTVDVKLSYSTEIEELDEIYIIAEYLRTTFQHNPVVRDLRVEITPQGSVWTTD